MGIRLVPFMVALASVVAGLDAGVKRLSEINMALAAILLLFVILVGPTLAILTGFFKNLAAYAYYLPELSNPFGRADDNFRQGWTAFYWAWWISWSPFVGMFIARVSRGRRPPIPGIVSVDATEMSSGQRRPRSTIARIAPKTMTPLAT